MIKTNKRAAITVAAIFLGIASPAGASVVNGEVTFEETRCQGNCTGQAINPFLDVNSLGATVTSLTGPASLGGSVVEGQYLGGNLFGFDFSTVTNPSVGGIISGIDFATPGTEISGTTVSFSGSLENAVLFTAFQPDSIAVFVERASNGFSRLTAGLVTLELMLNVPNTGNPPDPMPDTPSSVPLPAGLPLILAGLAGLGLAARRKV